MATLLKDLRHGMRLLARSPGISLIAVTALAIGIGANTAIFSVVNTLLLRPLPYRDAERLAIVWEHNLPRDRRSNVVSPGNFLHWRDLNQVFSEIGAVALTGRVTLTGAGEPEELPSQRVDAPFFSVLGVQPALGRPFTSEEDRPGSYVAVISDRLWKRRLNADPHVLQRSIVLQGLPHTVVGVMPPGFSFLDKSVDVWLPVGFTAESRTPRGRWLQVVGRLKPSVTLETAHADMTRVAQELTRRFPDFNTGWTTRVVSVRDQLTGNVRPALLVLLGAVAFVLLIACANVANLLLARATARQRELAVRAALGAGRGRLIRQLLAESLALAAAGGLAGLFLAWWALNVLRAVAAERLPIQRLEMVGLDGWVLGFTLVASVLCGLLFGAAPALMVSGLGLNDALKEGGRTGAGVQGKRARNVFVVVEMALALVLLAGAGLLVRSFMRLADVDPGFDADQTLTLRVSLPSSRYREAVSAAQFYERLHSGIDSLPGVVASGSISFLPLVGLGAATRYEVVDEPPPPLGQEPVADVRVIDNDYFKAMGVPLIRGRLFTDDPADSKNRIIVNETMARRHWPNDDPIGKRVRISWNDDREDVIVGIVGDVRQADLGTEARATTYWPYRRFPYGSMTIAVRTPGDTRMLAGSVTRLVRELDPNLAVADVRTMEDVVDESVAERRLTMTLLTVFAIAAVVLAGVGIYGVIAYSVSQRTKEIGIRMALGAQPREVVRMVLAQGAGLALAGVAAGTIGALLLTRLMSGLLFEVDPADPTTFLVVAAVLGAVAVVASYVPGRRATRIDPVIALRAE